MSLWTAIEKKEAKRHIDLFVNGYREALLWSSSDTDPTTGELVEGLLDYELSPEAEDLVIADCTDFIDNHGHLVKQAATHKDYGGYGRAGHDFWLTRVGHGAGYWDGDLPKELGESLTEASKGFHNLDPYIGDDGLIHLV